MIEQLEQDYVRAVIRERTVREIAFLPVTENICGLEVVPMTLRHLLALRLIGCPFLINGEPTQEDCFVFLWHLSKDYSPRNMKAKRKILKRCRKRFFLTKPPWIHFAFRMLPWQKKTVKKFERLEIVKQQIREFLADALMDRPPMREGNNKSYFSDAAAICHRFALKYSWSVNDVMDTPLKALFQFCKLIEADIRAEHKKNPIMFNPSDAVQNRILAELNAN